MNKCPFWSTGKLKTECYEECPMNNFFAINDNCPFKEYLSNGIKIKGIEEVENKSNSSEKLDSKYLSGYIK
ncbi:MAG: hypothetical protein E7214_00690 [Clostridium sp.]|nr:hypothetical protein [Clostridium sp.]